MSAPGDIPRRTLGRGTTIGVPALVSPSLARAPFDAAAESLGPLEREAFAQRGREIKAEQRRLRNEAAARVTEAANVLHARFSGDENPDVAAFHDAYEAEVGPIVDAIADEDVHADVSFMAKRHGLAIEDQFMQKNALFRQQSQEVDLDRHLRAKWAEFGLAADDDDRRRIREETVTEIGLAVSEGDISPTQGDARVVLSLRKEGGAYARNLIRTDPVTAMAALRDPDNEFLREMDPLVRERLFISAGVEQRRRLTEAAAFSTAQQEARETELIERMLIPDHPKGFPTTTDVQDAELGPEATKQLLEKIQGGLDFNFRDDALVTWLYNRVHDPTREDHIADPRELLEFLGRGLPTEQYQALLADIDKLQDSAAKVADRPFQDFLGLAARAISADEDVLGGENPRAATAIWAFRVAAETERDKLLASGVSMQEMLNPRHPKYLGNMIPAYRRSFEEQLNDQATALDVKPIVEVSQALVEELGAPLPAWLNQGLLPGSLMPELFVFQQFDPADLAAGVADPVPVRVYIIPRTRVNPDGSIEEFTAADVAFEASQAEADFLSFFTFDQAESFLESYVVGRETLELLANPPPPGVLPVAPPPGIRPPRAPGESTLDYLTRIGAPSPLTR